MKRQSVSIEKVAKRLAKHITEQEVYGWPPLCPALYSYYCYWLIRVNALYAILENKETTK